MSDCEHEYEVNADGEIRKVEPDPAAEGEAKYQELKSVLAKLGEALGMGDSDEYALARAGQMSVVLQAGLTLFLTEAVKAGESDHATRLALMLLAMRTMEEELRHERGGGK